ncbi:MAG: hypothetical protein V5A62_09230 [Haloarculaceae archaeon]
MTEPGMGYAGTAYLRCLQAVGRLVPYGENVYDREWDVLVVLDACRPDALETVASGVGFVDGVGRMRSVGSCSSEWLENTFDPATRGDAVAGTAMVTGNTWTDRYLDADAFAALDEVWKYAWDDDLGTVPAEAVTDRAVAVARTGDQDRLVVHYMQPHHPFVGSPLEGDDGMARTSRESSECSPWALLRRGDAEPDRVWEAYLANLEYVLESVGTLLENVGDRVAITADHGNLFGEWGLYGHPMHTPVPELLSVPWCETTARDRGTREPTLEPPEPLPVSRVYDAAGDRDRLEALGYL